MKANAWYKKLGFKENPLSIKPKDGEKLLGNEDKINKIIDSVEKGRLILVEGDYGFGKSTLLKRIIDRFKGEYRIIYYSCNRKNASIDYDKMLINAGSPFHRLFRIKKKHVILLLDEAQDMNIKDKKLLLSYFDDGYFHSIVLVSNGNQPDFSDKEFKERIGNEHYVLTRPNEELALKLVRDRIGNLELISDEIIKKVYKHSKNPRQLLEDIEDLCRFAVENNKDKISEEDVKEVLGYDGKSDDD